MPNAEFSLKGKRVWVAGHRGMAGSAIVRRLEQEDCEVVTAGRDQLDLRRQDAVEHWVADTKPDVVFLAAATVGGIHANSTRPAEFIYNNLIIEANVINAAHLADVNKLVFLGSSCIYPRMAAQPMREDSLLTGPLEPTNEWYATAKIAGIKMCQAFRKQYGRDYITAMPTNLYGRGDNYDPLQGHVVAAMLVKIHDAKTRQLPNVEIWGTGKPTREFLAVDDMADASVFLAKHYSDHEHVNIGTGIETSIRELVELVAETAGYTGGFEHNLDKPDGMPRKVMDIGKIKAMGWAPQIDLRTGLASAYQDYLEFLARKAKAA
ncbi:GDP-L-fucose synthase [Ferrovibrio sp.]|uniref:GDP-L-fucose synthase family protein n=1 Tax=Ferrovibrio sp. TaxID=1917215 RepID=UPI0025C48368|nr:GDP-L-fucose synthase [Ferrovibrio sp.]